MKRTLFFLALLAVAVLPVIARDYVTRDVQQLPVAAQNTIKSYFKSKKVNHIKIDKKSFGATEYDVIFCDGMEVEFDSHGNWTEIHGGNKSVPEKLIMRPILEYVKNNFKGKKIVSIEVDRNKYELELSNGVELEFDRRGRFLKADY